jgi:hypothetical protein
MDRYLPLRPFIGPETKDERSTCFAHFVRLETQVLTETATLWRHGATVEMIGSASLLSRVHYATANETRANHWAELPTFGMDGAGRGAGCG